VRGTLILVALALAGGLIVASARAATVASAKASLELVSVDPLRVAGAGFKPYERVRVTAWVDGTRTTAQARAGRRGAFQLRIAGSTGGPCRSSAILVAVGSRGSRTTVALDNIMCTPTY
jgi:hypothetical protein